MLICYFGSRCPKSQSDLIRFRSNATVRIILSLECHNLSNSPSVKSEKKGKHLLRKKMIKARGTRIGIPSVLCKGRIQVQPESTYIFGWGGLGSGSVFSNGPDPEISRWKEEKKKEDPHLKMQIPNPFFITDPRSIWRRTSYRHDSGWERE